jgi:hypothetical protein
LKKPTRGPFAYVRNSSVGCGQLLPVGKKCLFSGNNGIQELAVNGRFLGHEVNNYFVYSIKIVELRKILDRLDLPLGPE